MKRLLVLPLLVAALLFSTTLAEAGQVYCYPYVVYIPGQGYTVYYSYTPVPTTVVSPQYTTVNCQQFFSTYPYYNAGWNYPAYNPYYGYPYNSWYYPYYSAYFGYPYYNPYFYGYNPYVYFNPAGCTTVPVVSFAPTAPAVRNFTATESGTFSDSTCALNQACQLAVGTGSSPQLGSFAENGTIVGPLSVDANGCYAGYGTLTLTGTGNNQLVLALNRQGCKTSNGGSDQIAFAVMGGSGSFAGASGYGTIQFTYTYTASGKGTYTANYDGYIRP